MSDPAASYSPSVSLTAALVLHYQLQPVLRAVGVFRQVHPLARRTIAEGLLPDHRLERYPVFQASAFFKIGRLTITRLSKMFVLYYQ